MNNKTVWFLAVGVLLVVAVGLYSRQRDQQQRDERIFQTSTPEQHFMAGLQGWYGGDFGLATRHFEAIPKESSPYEKAVRAMRLAKIQHERPQEFEAAKKEDYRQCAARLQEPGICGVYIGGECDLYNYHFLRHEPGIDSVTLKP
jgi:hypothetical protein